jgi:hypothetical protein
MYPLLRRAITITENKNDVIRFREAGLTVDAKVAPGVYFLKAGAGGLLDAVRAAFEAAQPTIANTYSVTLTVSVNALQPTGVVTVTRLLGTDGFTIGGADPLTTFPLHVLGFDLITTSTASAPRSSTLSPSGIWVSNDMLTTDEPDFTGEVFGETPSRGGSLSAGAQSDTWDRYRWAVAYVARRRVWQEANPTDPNATWEAFWRRIRSAPVLELARIDPTTFAVTDLPNQWVADLATRQSVGPVRLGPGTPIYSWPMTFEKWVTP